jgi:glycerol-3-phosphate acyltransferase PlsY
MNPGRLAWAVGAYFAGTFPSPYVVARIAGVGHVLSEARAGVSEGDAHLLIEAQAGRGWGALAAALDVGKALAYVLAARHLGDLPPWWLAAVGVLLVAGHVFPFYLRRLAGRGLAAAAGVLLALVPLALVVAGVIIVIGYVLGTTGPASTLGFAVAPFVALASGRPAAIVGMCAALFGLILLRRLVGVSEAARGVGWTRAVVWRLLFDTDGSTKDPEDPRRPQGPAVS